MKGIIYFRWHKAYHIIIYTCLKAEIKGNGVDMLYVMLINVVMLLESQQSHLFCWGKNLSTKSSASWKVKCPKYNALTLA